MLEAVQRWADDDLRSLNGQIEFLLRRALADADRARPKGPAESSEPSEPRRGRSTDLSDTDFFKEQGPRS